MGMVSKENRLKYICRKCYYRRTLAYDSFYNGKSRLDSYCAFFLIEGEQRGCTPSQGECARFKPRMKFDSTWGRHETIK